MHRSPSAVNRNLAEIHQNNYRELFRQQGERVWNADRDIDWDKGFEIPPEKRDAWLKLINAFYGLELMGLETLQVMLSKATHKVRDPNLNLYLAAQCHDEARHAYVLSRYMDATNGHGHLSKLEQGLIDRFVNLASFGLYRVENWLTSTLFSENFAALFLQTTLELPDTDPLAKDIFRLILRDEVRHVNFLHTILPEMIDNLSPIGRAYIWQSQILLVAAVSIGLRRLRNSGNVIGLNIADFKHALIYNLDAQFKDANIDHFLHAESYRRVVNFFI